MWNFILDIYDFIYLRMSLYVRITIWGVRVKNMFSDVGKTLSCYTPPIFTSDSSLFLPFSFCCIFSCNTIWGTRQGENKKGYLPRQPIFC